MYRVTRSYFFFLVIFIFAVESARAVSFATEYKITIDGQEIGSMSRHIHNEGDVSVTVYFIPSGGGAAFYETWKTIQQIMCSRSFTGLNPALLRHAQALAASITLRSPNDGQENSVSMTLREDEEWSQSIDYNIQGLSCSYNEASSSGDAAVRIAGNSEVFRSNRDDGFHVSINDTVNRSIADGEQKKTTTNLGDHDVTSTLGALTSAVLADKHDQPVTAPIYLLGRRFEEQLTGLVDGGSANSNLLNLVSIFPVFSEASSYGQFSIEMKIGYGQALVYDPVSNRVIQQDPADDPNPCHVTTTYQLNSERVVSSITIRDESSEVKFSSEQKTESESKRRAGSFCKKEKRL